jgi:hypothetical protein
MTKITPRYTVSIALLLGLLCTGELCAQQLAASDTPSLPTAPAASVSYSSSNEAGDPSMSPALIDAPTPQTPTSQSNDSSGKQTSRILGIIPNFRAVSVDQHLPPQTIKDKFVTASQDTFDYSAIVVPAGLAGFNLARNATPEFGHGGVAYGRYFWHSLVDQTVENYMVEFVVPAATHEDTRYYTLGHGGFLKRTGYALSRTVITRSDSGKEVFNAGEVVGAGAGAGLSNLYYPSRERGLGNTGTQWGTSIGIDAATFVLKEFWPDINNALFHNKD